MHRAAEEPRRHADAQAAARRRWRPTRCAIVGDPVACVVAETAVQAKDAAEAVELDIEPLPAVTPAERGRQAGRAAALRRRARQRRARLSLRRCRRGRSRLRPGRPCHPADAAQQPRLVVNAMEPRAARRGLRPGKRALHLSCRLARACSACAPSSPTSLNVAPAKVRMLTGQVGGSFGMKAQCLSGIYLRPARRARAGPSGEMDRRTLRQLSLRQPRPRPRVSSANWRSTPTAISSRCG